MTYSLASWLGDALRAEGVTVVECDGWQKRGRGNILKLKGGVSHHTAGPFEGDHPSLNTIIDGREGLSGPLAQILLSRSGVAYLAAAGVANHAGRGRWPWPNSGVLPNRANECTIGIEWENVGREKFNPEPIQPGAYDAYVKIWSAVCKHAKLDPKTAIIAHREWAPSRKTDPCGIDMSKFRADIKLQMEGKYVGRVGVGTVGEVLPSHGGTDLRS